MIRSGEKVEESGVVMSRTEIDEADLLRRTAEGDLRSFSVLVETYKERAVRAAFLNVGNLEDARDLAQDAFVKAYENLSSFRGQSQFYTWYYRILSNTCKDFLRKKKVRKMISFWLPDSEEREDPVLSVPDASKNAADRAVNAELGRKLAEAVQRLPSQQRIVFSLRHEDDLSLAEIAKMLDLSEGAVKAHLWQAMQKMKSWLKDDTVERG